MRQLYASLEGEDFSPFRIELKDAERLNSLKYGIFWTVNDFDGSRLISNIRRIRSWFVEIDSEDKQKTLKRILSASIIPSLIVETKNGYHVYFDAKDATKEKYRDIQDGLCDYFGADKRARDLARLLRVPGFYHWKDQNNPFLVKEVFRCEVAYPEQAMLYYFVKPKSRLHAIKIPPKSPLDLSTEDEVTLSAKLSKLDHEVALRHLSGTEYVNYEVYEFKPVPRGRLNIIINGKSTSCFIDEHKMIGAVPGGPTIWQWLKYYGHSNTDISYILKKEFGL